MRPLLTDLVLYETMEAYETGSYEDPAGALVAFRDGHTPSSLKTPLAPISYKIALFIRNLATWKVISAYLVESRKTVYSPYLPMV